MQEKKILKVTLIVFITILFVLSVRAYATNDTSLDDLIAGESTARIVDDPVVSEDETLDAEELGKNVDNDSAEEEPSVGSTANDVAATSAQTSQSQTTYNTGSYSGQSAQPTKSYSTVATIPEANLSLNNILNVILIAVGVIIILLAIAILIRIK